MSGAGSGHNLLLLAQESRLDGGLDGGDKGAKHGLHHLLLVKGGSRRGGADGHLLGGLLGIALDGYHPDGRGFSDDGDDWSWRHGERDNRYILGKSGRLLNLLDRGLNLLNGILDLLLVLNSRLLYS